MPNFWFNLFVTANAAMYIGLEAMLRKGCNRQTDYKNIASKLPFWCLGDSGWHQHQHHHWIGFNWKATMRPIRWSHHCRQCQSQQPLTYKLLPTEIFNQIFVKVFSSLWDPLWPLIKAKWFCEESRQFDPDQRECSKLWYLDSFAFLQCFLLFLLLLSCKFFPNKFLSLQFFVLANYVSKSRWPAFLSVIVFFLLQF